MSFIWWCVVIVVTQFALLYEIAPLVTQNVEFNVNFKRWMNEWIVCVCVIGLTWANVPRPFTDRFVCVFGRSRNAIPGRILLYWIYLHQTMDEWMNEWMIRHVFALMCVVSMGMPPIVRLYVRVWKNSHECVPNLNLYVANSNTATVNARFSLIFIPLVHLSDSGKLLHSVAFIFTLYIRSRISVPTHRHSIHDIH